MAVPRNRLSNARKNKRRAHDHKKPKSLGKCSNCGVEVVPHRICAACGFYNKKQIITKSA